MTRRIYRGHNPDRSKRPSLPGCLLLGSIVAALSVFWLAPPAFSSWLPQMQGSERTVSPRGDLGADEQANIQLFENSRDSVVYIRTSQLVRDVWSRNVLAVPRGTGSFADVDETVIGFPALKQLWQPGSVQGVIR